MPQAGAFTSSGRKPSPTSGDPIYFFDLVEDRPDIGGVAAVSRRLREALAARLGPRLVAVRGLAASLGCGDPREDYLPRERRAILRLAERDPHATFLIPNFQSPVDRPPGRLRPRIVNIVHDTQFAQLTDLFTPDQRAWLGSAFAETRANADAVAFVSRATRDDFHRLFGAPLREAIIPPPLGGSAWPAAVAPPVAARPYLLAVQHGTHHPHKNVDGLLRLFAALTERFPDLDLLVAGRGEGVLPAGVDLPEPLRRRARHLGFVPRAELDALHRGARAFVSLSRFEGFNMAAAEAARHGTPLILSDLPAHRELHGAAACLLDPLAPDVEAAAEWLRGAAGLRGYSWEHAERCSAEAVAEAHLRLMGEVDAASGPPVRRMSATTRVFRVGTGRRRRAGGRDDAARAAVRRQRLARALLAGTVLGGAATVCSMFLESTEVRAATAPPSASCTSGATNAVGGNGGASSDFASPGVGGCNTNSGNQSIDGSASSAPPSMAYYGGGGGGGGTDQSLTRGGNGGSGDGGVTAGGPGGTTPGTNGQPGSSATSTTTGGGGGGGGYYGGVIASPGAQDLKTVKGGDGGGGGSAYYSGAGNGGGGGGGGGGAGLIVTATGVTLSSGTAQGGAGGQGGQAYYGTGGDGGAGGIGTIVSASNGPLVLTGGVTLTGGGGGAGGFSSSNNGGNGGSGGAGLVVVGNTDIVPVTVATNASIVGGNGGAAGVTNGGNAVAAGVTNGGNAVAAPGSGPGGAGIVGANLAIATGGSIAGGTSGDGAGQANAITFTGGGNTLSLNTGFAFTGNIAVTGSLTFAQGTGQATDAVVDNLNGGTTAIVDGPGGPGSVVKTGPGRLILSGANSYSGGTTIRGGVVQFWTALSLGAGPVTIDGGTLQSAAQGNADFGQILADPVRIGGAGGTVDLNGNSFTLAGGLSDAATPSGPLTVTDSTGRGGQTLTVSGPSTFSGGTIVTGTAAVQANSADALGTGALRVDAGSYFLLGGYDQAVTRLTGQGTIFDIGSFTAPVSNTLTVQGGDFGGLIEDGRSSNGSRGTTSLAKTSAGTLVLSGQSYYTGDTTVLVGTLRAGSATGFADYSAFTVAGGATLDLGGYGNAVRALAGSGLVTNSGPAAASLTVGGVDDTSSRFDGTLADGAAALALVKAGAGTLTLTGADTYTGGTTISGGTLRIGAGGTTGAIVGDVADDAALAFARSDTVTFSGAISGTGSLTQAGTGTLNLTGTSTYTGDTTVASGRLAVNGALGDTAVTVAPGATLGGSGAIAGAVTVADGGILAPGNSPGILSVGALTLTPGTNGSTGSLLNYELGTVAAGNGPASDRTDVAGNLVLAGTLNATDAGGFTYGSYRIFNYGGALTNDGLAIGSLPAGYTGVVQTVIPNQVNLVVASPTTPVQFWDGPLPAGSGTIAGGTGAWDNRQTNWTDPNGANNAPWGRGIGIFTGAAGTVTVADAIAFQGLQFITDGYAVTSAAGGSLQPTGQAFIRVGAGATATVSAPITGAGGLVKLSNGTLVLAADDTFTGGTTVSEGTLQLGNGGAAGSVAGDIANNSALVFDHGTAVTYGGVISGTGSLFQVGAGALTLTGANSYTGQTAVSAGTTLALAGRGSIAASSGVAIDGTLDLSASGGASLTSLSGGGTVVLGAQRLTLTDASGTFSGAIGGAGSLALQAGTLTLTGASSYTGGTTIAGGTLRIGAGGTTGSIVGDVVDNAALAFARSDAVTFGGAVSGTGSLTQAGPGTLTLTGASSYTGGTTIGGGTLRIGAGGTTGSIVGDVVDNAALAFARSDAVTFGGAVSGTGSLTQAGPGTLTLTGANTYTGGTTISGGTLRIGAGGTTGSIVGNVADAGTLAFDRADAVAFAGRISGSGAVVKAGGGTLTLTGDNSYAGGTFLRQGALAIARGTALGTGPLSMDDGTTLRFKASGVTLGNDIVLTGVADPVIDSGAGTVTLSGGLSGAGALTKAGSGTLILTGPDAATGPTRVAAGTLEVDGAAASSAVTIGTGATLSGTGSVGSITAGGGARLAPGSAANPYGTLRTPGSAVFARNATFQVAVDATGRSSALAVGGTATLGGASVTVTSAPGTYDASTRYTILTAAGGVQGVFGTLSTAEALAFLSPYLTYGADAVTLNFRTNGTSFADVAATPNERRVATALQSLDPAGALVRSLQGLSPDAARRALDALAGATHAGVATAAAQDARRVSTQILDRLWNIGGGEIDARTLLQQLGSPAPLPAFVNCYAPVEAPPPRAPATIATAWGEGFGDFGHDGADRNGAGLDRSLGGFVVGYDAPLHGLGAPYRIGVAGGYTNDTFSGTGAGGGGSGGTFESVFGSIYGGARYGAVDLRLGAAVAGTSSTVDRAVAYPGFLDHAHSNYGGNTEQVFGEVGYRFSGALWVVEPVADAAWIHVHQDGFHERGGLAALTGFAQDDDVGTTTLGARGEIAPFTGVPLVARAFLGWRHAFGDVDPGTRLAFQAGSIPFTSQGAALDRDAFASEVGLDWRFSGALTLGLAYTGQIGARDDDNGVKGRFEYKF